MRCPQCGFDAVAGAGFCSRCGTRLLTPRPESKREFALSRIMTSWWTFFGSFVAAAVAEAMAVVALHSPQAGQGGRPVAVALFVLGLLIVFFAIVKRRSTSWSITSERLIERRGFLSQTRREVELADIRSVEVSRTFFQRLFGIGSVGMQNVSDPESIAETVRRARLKRLA